MHKFAHTTVKRAHNNAPARLFLRPAAAFCLALFLCLPPFTARADVIVYDDSGTLQSLPTWSLLWGQSVYPGTQADPIASGNEVTINYSSGAEPGFVFGGLSNHSDVTGNSVSLVNGSVRDNVYGGGSENDNAEYNSVNISGGSVGDSVYGGWNDGGGALSWNNSVSISGGSVGDSVFGGWSRYDTEYNSVSISGGSVTGDVYGGWSQDGNAEYNSVSISGGSVSGDVYGGYVNAGTGNATGNTVTLAGRPDLAAVGIYGGGGNSSGNLRSGNTLSINGFQGAVKEIVNFENYNFTLNSSLSAATPLIEITGNNPVDLTGAKVAVSGLVELPPGTGAGESFTLIDKTSGTPGSLQSSLTGLSGISMSYELDLAAGANALNFTVSRAIANQRVKALSEGRMAGLAFVNQAADLVAGPGLYSALDATGQRDGFYTFGAFSGGNSRYKTGSHVDLKGLSLMSGLARRSAFEYGGSLLLGAFVEAGRGNYDTYNSFSSQPSVRGDGDTDYAGAGLLARYGSTCGLYLDASLRLGHADSDFSTSDLRDTSGRKADYDSSSTYYGGHTGLGYLWDINDATRIDFSSHFFWTRQKGDSVNVSGDSFHFKSSDSQRWRSGGRISHSGPLFTPYLGAYYEHEFDGKAKATVNGQSIGAPELKGDTGVGELGLGLRPSDEIDLYLDLVVQGYIGRREGASGNLQLKWTF